MIKRNELEKVVRRKQILWASSPGIDVKDNNKREISPRPCPASSRSGILKCFG
jgi:hypothetical protein